jgi:hypothetical protein
MYKYLKTIFNVLPLLVNKVLFLIAKAIFCLAASYTEQSLPACCPKVFSGVVNEKRTLLS